MRLGRGGLTMDKLNDPQTVFMVFYAIFWGAIFGVLPRWKPFQWPLFLFYCKVACRVILSCIFFNIIPLWFFILAMSFLSDRHQSCVDPMSYFYFTWHAVVPSFVLLGFYRIWLGIIECCPQMFYYSSYGHEGLDEKYKWVEPIYNPPNSVIKRNCCTEKNTPVVELNPDGGWPNLFFGALYVAIGFAGLW